MLLTRSALPVPGFGITAASLLQGRGARTTSGFSSDVSGYREVEPREDARRSGIGEIASPLLPALKACHSLPPRRGPTRIIGSLDLPHPEHRTKRLQRPPIPTRLLDPALLLCALALPALALSFWLLHAAHAPSAAFLQQALAIAVGITLLLLLRRCHLAPSSTPWLVLGLAVSLWLPIVLSSEPYGPARWLSLAGLRLYFAPVVLPLMIFLLSAPLAIPALLHLGVVATTALALTLQPDAAQLTAYSFAILASLFISRVSVISQVSGLRRWFAPALLALLVPCLYVAWRIPDPLAPVPYVEGVFNIAAVASPIALLAALAFAAMPVAGFVWLAWAHRSSAAIRLATLPVAAYYAALFALAPLQITPVPLLGYGAGPILGYFLVTAAQRQSPQQSTRLLPTNP